MSSDPFSFCTLHCVMQISNHKYRCSPCGVCGKGDRSRKCEGKPDGFWEKAITKAFRMCFDAKIVSARWR